MTQTQIDELLALWESDLGQITTQARKAWYSTLAAIPLTEAHTAKAAIDAIAGRYEDGNRAGGKPTRTTFVREFQRQRALNRPPSTVVGCPFCGARGIVYVVQAEDPQSKPRRLRLVLKYKMVSSPAVYVNPVPCTCDAGQATNRWHYTDAQIRDFCQLYAYPDTHEKNSSAAAWEWAMSYMKSHQAGQRERAGFEESRNYQPQD